MKPSVRSWCVFVCAWLFVCSATVNIPMPQMGNVALGRLFDIIWIYGWLNDARWDEQFRLLKTYLKNFIKTYGLIWFWLRFIEIEMRRQKPHGKPPNGFNWTFLCSTVWSWDVELFSPPQIWKFSMGFRFQHSHFDYLCLYSNLIVSRFV